MSVCCGLLEWGHPSAQAVLPTLWVAHAWMVAGWGVVAGAAGLGLVRRLTQRKWIHAVVPLCVLAWMVLPGKWGGGFWMGLAFQAPSVSLVLVCAVFWARQLAPPRVVARLPVLQPRGPMAVGAIVCGWLLLLDTLGLLPGSLYALGFTSLAPVLAVACIACAWVIQGPKDVTDNVLIAMASVFTHSLLRWPTGNLFDALFDPFLWIALHIQVYWRWKFGSRVSGKDST
ncbi:MAG: hypothetical protein CFE44_01075 [Burkholderiales bacterium PBB4]|nr:MAG: hypothetical protein CFE44_01075 [Burkholderiales bacterium PBB4]